MPSKSILLLAYYHPRYIVPLRQLGERLAKLSFVVTPLFADEHYKSEVIEHLRQPFDLVIYFGHGEPGVLSGYRGICQEELPRNKSLSLPQTLIILSCSSLDQTPDGSIADNFISRGLAENVIGYQGKIKYKANKKFLELIGLRLEQDNDLNILSLQALAEKCGITNLDNVC